MCPGQGWQSRSIIERREGAVTRYAERRSIIEKREAAGDGGNPLRGAPVCPNRAGEAVVSRREGRRREAAGGGGNPLRGVPVCPNRAGEAVVQ